MRKTLISVITPFKKDEELRSQTPECSQKMKRQTLTNDAITQLDSFVTGIWGDDPLVDQKIDDFLAINEIHSRV